MATIRCPHCGSPVMVRGNRWECGWCGDFGDISSLNRSERIKLSPASDTALEDLEVVSRVLRKLVCRLWDE